MRTDNDYEKEISHMVGIINDLETINAGLLAAHDELARALFRIRSITIRKLDHIEVANIACDAVLHLDESPFFPAKATESEGER